MKIMYIIFSIFIITACSTMYSRKHHSKYVGFIHDNRELVTSADHVIMFKKICKYNKEQLLNNLSSDYQIKQMKTITRQINRSLSHTDKIIYDALRGSYSDAMIKRADPDKKKLNQQVRSEIQVRLLEKLDHIKLRAIDEDDLGYPIVIKRPDLHISLFPSSRKFGRIMAFAKKKGGTFKDIDSINVLYNSENDKKFFVYVNTYSGTKLINEYVNNKLKQRTKYCIKPKISTD